MPGTALAAAFARTSYRVCLPTGACEVRIGQQSPAIDAWCRTTWAIVAAVNPGAIQHPAAENERRHAALQRELAQMNARIRMAENIDPEGVWPNEPSVCIAGWSLASVLALAARYGQRAVVFAEYARPAALFWTPDGLTTLESGH